jgi:tRNA-specific adenosine deaminase 3
VIDVIRQVADYRASRQNRETSTAAKDPAASTSVNGTNYLLTSMSIFITHEPCIMCSMALLHSRVREVFFLIPMPSTGGCGGSDGEHKSVCVSKLDGVNHRFRIGQWRRGRGLGLHWRKLLLDVDVSIDA